MMDKATPTSRARKPFFFLAKNLNDLSSFLRKKKMQGMDPSLKATWSVIIIVTPENGIFFFLRNAVMKSVI